MSSDLLQALSNFFHTPKGSLTKSNVDYPHLLGPTQICQHD